jgi:NAD(P)-dependent dehydrogenase (short-subunit alcohol dehydrogenase family)
MTNPLFALTGSASGIGKALYNSLKAQGNDVIGIDINDADIIADLSTPAGRAECTKNLSAAAKDGLNGFIPCAGVGGHLGLSDKVIEVNYFGSTELLEAAYPLLQAKQGCVVVIGSNSMAMPNPDTTLIEILLKGEREQALMHVQGESVDPYPSAKIALCTWMRRKAIEWARRGVRMNAIAPGITETNLVATQRKQSEMLDKALTDFAETSPMGYAAAAQSIADVILFLLSPTAHYICGEVLYADGGHAAQFRPEHV